MTYFKQDHSSCSAGVHRCKGDKDARRKAAAVSQAEMGWLGLVGGDVASASNLGLL